MLIGTNANDWCVSLVARCDNNSHPLPSLCFVVGVLDVVENVVRRAWANMMNSGVSICVDTGLAGGD